MGGIGSGSYLRFSGKPTVDDYCAIDVRVWARRGFLNAGKVFGWHWTREGVTEASIQVRVQGDFLRLVYKCRVPGDDWDKFDYPVWLTRTPCHLGGERVWFLCPAKGCGRRVAKLYGGRVFACRKCYGLAYPSQTETIGQRAARKAESINDRLGWRHSVLDGIGPRPIGMHHRTYERLTDQFSDFMAISDAEMIQLALILSGRI